ncbi:MAG: PAS domain-containing protein [Planctomycetaceae bacterium]|nr:PAS domain-containing protein [Planctomycetaceae bacterium]
MTPEDGLQSLNHQLRQSLDVLGMLDEAPTGIAFLDSDMRYLYINSTLAAMNCISAADTVGRTIYEIIPWAVAAIEPHLRGVLGDGRSISNIEISESLAGGRSGRYWIQSFYPISRADGAVWAVGVLVTEITDRKRIEAALWESQAHARAILNTIPDPAWLKDTHGRFLAVNAAWRKFFGIEACDAIGTTGEGTLPSHVQERIRVEDEQVLRTGRPLNTERVLQDDQGKVRYFETIKSPVHDEHGAVIGTAGIARDITRRRQAEDQLRQSQKLEAVGRLAGGVAHDFRNQLTIIKGYAEMLTRRELVQEQAVEYVEEIIAAANRSADVAQQLLAFSRQQILRPQVLDINVLLRDISRSLVRLLSNDVVYSHVSSESPCVAEVDAGQLQQAMMNLILNARDAMPNGGRLILEVQRVEIDEPLAAPGFDCPAGPYVRISVSDTGCGMEESSLSHLFEPFFTTKPTGEGTGLGLAMVHGFVRQSGGAIRVASRPGCGTTFNLFLPLREEAAQPAPQPPAAGLPRGAGTIVLVEDEAGVRQWMTETLRECGYVVYAAGSAREASQLCDRHAGPIDLLITDVVMPQGDGPHVARYFQDRRPGIAVMFISGHAGKALTDRGLVGENIDMLNKPFGAAELAQTVKDILSR